MLLKNQHKILFFNIEALQSRLGGTIEVINGIHTLYFDNSNGRGKIRYLAFDDGLVTINLEVTLTETLILALDNPNTEAMSFIFCLSGDCFYASEKSNITRKIKELQSVVIKNSKKVKNTILIKPNNATIINVVCLDKLVYFKKNNSSTYLPKSQLTDLLEVLDFKDKNIHFGSYNLKIGECVKSLVAKNEDNDMTERMRFEGVSHFILANHINQLSEESKNSQQKSSLNGTEIKSISVAISMIKENPQDSFSIDMLCGVTGLSPAKLQEGFKALSNRTVSDYIRQVRLQKSQHLIKTTDLNISEIVYTIGFTSRSYFCKIFKNEFGYTPKQYKQKIKLEVLQ